MSHRHQMMWPLVDMLPFFRVTWGVKKNLNRQSRQRVKKFAEKWSRPVVTSAILNVRNVHLVKHRSIRDNTWIILLKMSQGCNKFLLRSLNCLSFKNGIEDSLNVIYYLCSRSCSFALHLKVWATPDLRTCLRIDLWRTVPAMYQEEVPFPALPSSQMQIQMRGSLYNSLQGNEIFRHDYVSNLTYFCWA